MSDDVKRGLALLPDLADPAFADARTAELKALRATLPKGVKIPAPREAATLIIKRQTPNGPEILMGRRHGGHKFLPNVFVFPGGRVDTGDLRVFPDLKLSADTSALVASHKGPARARALGLACIRETFEESGIVVGTPLAGARAPRTKNNAWRAFADTGHLPALGALEVVFRAITPPHHNKRFDTWFFMVDIGAVPAAAKPLGKGSGELEELQWASIEQAADLKLVAVTYAVLSVLKTRFERGPGAPVAIPYSRFVNGRYTIGTL